MKVKDNEFVSFDDLLSKEMEDVEFNEKFNNEYLKTRIINEFVSIRKNSKLTQKQMADMVGIPEGNISRFESGKVAPTLDFIQNLATRLGYEINIKLEKLTK